ncbi:MAG: flagellar filament capping protein FliD [Planctomycetota bacterium]|nr:flagellar filament capping protein FliD [Planctomycetota bacterium]
MGGITSGVGLFSGINSAQLIDQLLSLEARPKQTIQRRVVGLQQQRAAYLDINSTLLALKTAASRFRTADSFQASKAESSDTAVLTASASSTAAAGSYSFLVKRLVTTQQQLSRGFTDATSSGLGLTSLTFETGGGRLDSDTQLSELNGGTGVERGKIVITDASGSSATVDLSTAVTVGDVLEAINTASGVRVSATVDGDSIKITDRNDAGSGRLTVANASGYNTAASLGIAGAAGTAGFGQSITGARVRTLSGATALATLNDGTGVNIRDGSTDLLIQTRDGSTLNIELGQKTETVNGVNTVTRTRATSLQDVLNYINTQGGGKVTAALNADRTGLVLTDNTVGGGNLVVANGSADRSTAQDLGIATGPGGEADGVVDGRRLIASLNSTLTRGLAGGSGLSDTALTIVDRSGNDTAITLSAGALSGSVSDLIKTINDQLAADGSNARVGLNRAGNGLSLEDTAGGGTALSASGAAATALGLSGSSTTGQINGTNLQSKWIGRATELSRLNGGKGIGTGTIRITDASGAVSTISITESLKNVDDLLKFLNAAPGSSISAEINSTGDGIVIRDDSGVSGTLKIEDVSGTVAKNLNIAGSDDGDGGVTELNGSYEKTVALSATDTLNAVVNKINAAGAGVSASVIRDGAGAAPFRLSLTSQRSGSVGRFTVDSGSVDLGLSRLSRGDDAVAFYGSGDPARAVLLTSSSNTLDNVVQGVTIDLKTTSDTAVNLVVSRDTEAVEKSVTDFVAAYNAVIDKLDRYDSYDTESQQATALFGDSTIGSLRSTLSRYVQSGPDGVTGRYTRLFQVGVTIGAEGKLEFDRDDFRTALENDPEGVKALFSARDAVARESTVEIRPGIRVNNTSTATQFTRLGVAEKLAEMVSGMTSSVDGTLTRRGRTIDTQIEAQNDRVAAIDVKLASKRARLEKQFADMEKAIASLQSQSSALGSLSR